MDLAFLTTMEQARAPPRGMLTRSNREKTLWNRDSGHETLLQTPYALPKTREDTFITPKIQNALKYNTQY